MTPSQLKMINNLTVYSLVCQNTRKCFACIKELLDSPLRKGVSKAKQTELVIELLSKDSSPLIDHINGKDLRRIMIKGEGTKKDPYKAEWGSDYYL